MIQTIKNNIQIIIATIVLAFAAIATSLAMPVTSHAQGTGQHKIRDSLCGSADDLSLSAGESCAAVAQSSESGLNDLITNVVNIFSAVVGIVAVIMIIFGGFRYITSGGDSNNVSGAKNTILYAIVGLIIVALAQIIVRFVLGAATNNTGV